MNRVRQAHREQVPVRPDNRPESGTEATNGALDGVESARRKKLAQIPKSQRPVFLRAWTGKSRKAAIQAFCLECMGYERAEVSRCTALACPLYPYRGARL